MTARPHLGGSAAESAWSAPPGWPRNTAGFLSPPRHERGLGHREHVPCKSPSTALRASPQGRPAAGLAN